MLRIHNCHITDELAMQKMLSINHICLRLVYGRPSLVFSA